MLDFKPSADLTVCLTQASGPVHVLLVALVTDTTSDRDHPLSLSIAVHAR